MNRVRRSGSGAPVPVAAPVVAPAVAKPRVKATATDDTLVRNARSSSIAVKRPSIIETRPLPTTVETRVAAALNAITFRRLAERAPMASAPTLLGIIAPLLHGATDPQVDRVIAELGLKDFTRAQVFDGMATIFARTSVKTAIWVRPDYVVDSDFSKRVEERLNTHVVQAGAGEVAHKVNSFAFNSTHGRIGELAPSDVFATREVLPTSAAAFDPLWIKGFDERETVAEYPFAKADGNVVAVRMMTGVIECEAVATGDYRAVKIPMDSSLSLVVLVPAEEVPLENIVRDLSSVSGSAAFYESLKVTTGQVYIPQMNVAWRGDALAELGPAARGPYEAIGARPVQLTSALGAAVFRLQEKGLESGAGHSASFAGPKKPPELIEANRPFLYMLRDDTNGLLLAAGVFEGPATA